MELKANDKGTSALEQNRSGQESTVARNCTEPEKL